jgi:hypothetical protein
MSHVEVIGSSRAFSVVSGPTRSIARTVSPPVYYRKLTGTIRDAVSLPEENAMLILDISSHIGRTQSLGTWTALASESVLKKLWDTPEEDEYWAYLDEVT